MSNKAEVFVPGEYLQEELEARGWSHEHLAKLADWSVEQVAEVIAGKRKITFSMGMGLSAAFGTSVELWTNLQATYDAALESFVEEFADLFTEAGRPGIALECLMGKPFSTEAMDLLRDQEPPNKTE